MCGARYYVKVETFVTIILCGLCSLLFESMLRFGSVRRQPVDAAAANSAVDLHSLFFLFHP